jgi:hypothetical protein
MATAYSKNINKVEHLQVPFSLGWLEASTARNSAEKARKCKQNSLFCRRSNAKSK